MSATTRGAFSMEAESVGTRCIVRVTGELDLGAAGELEALIRDRIQRHRKIVLDLDGLSFIDSTGIRTVLAMHQECAADGRQLLAVGGGPEVTRILEICGLRDVGPFVARSAGRGSG
jgi:anti-anti-sigma factor